MRYIAPLHLFLFAVFLLFLIPNFTGRHYFDLDPGPGAETASTGFWVVNADGSRTEVDPDDPAALRNELGLPEAVGAVIGMARKLQKDPVYYGYKLETLAYKLSFLTVPFSVVILWLLHAWRRRFSLYHHAVVSLYGLGFFAVLAALASLFPAAVAAWLYPAVFAAAAVHATVHIRGAYGSGWIRTVLRTLALGVLTYLAFGVFILGLIVLGVTG